MDISQAIFLQYTMNQVSPEYNQNINVAYIANEDIQLNRNVNYAPVSGEISVENIGSTISDEALEELYGTAKVPTKNTKPSGINFSTSYRDFNPAEISRIKEIIYNLHNNSSTGGTNTPGTGGTNTPGTGGTDTPGTGGTDTPGTGGTDTPGTGGTDTPGTGNSSDKKSFISAFCDTETIFEYMNSINPTITKDTGITRAQLIEFTQNDRWEDANYDFFGSLNRIFSELDTDNNGILTYSEIETFIGDELGEEFITYKNKINAYTQSIQTQYAALSNQKKLEFAIEKTREYLTASNMTAQIDALNRLTSQTDLYNTIKVGQIAIADLNKGNNSGTITLGSYMSYSYPSTYTAGGVTYSTGAFAFDNDDNAYDADLGITLDISLLNGRWYELVNTLVHELTHATAYQYYSSSGNGAVTTTTVEKLYNIGALTESEYNWYLNNFSSLSNSSDATMSAKLSRLFYLAACAWGEYSAYQADADYNDSIGQDVYSLSGDNKTTAVNGDQEKTAIMNHIESYYNTPDDIEALPDYKWWSFA